MENQLTDKHCLITLVRFFTISGLDDSDKLDKGGDENFLVYKTGFYAIFTSARKSKSHLTPPGVR